MATLFVRASSGDAIVVVESTEDWDSDHVGAALYKVGFDGIGLGDALMGPRAVEIVQGVFAEDVEQIALVADEHMVETLSPYDAEAALAPNSSAMCGVEVSTIVQRTTIVASTHHNRKHQGANNASRTRQEPV